jgi:hypothetical protein
MYCGVNQSLQIKLGESHATVALPWAAVAFKTDQTPTASQGTTNGISAVTIVASTTGLLKTLFLRNSDSITHSLTFIYNDNSVLREVIVVVLEVGDFVEYSSQAGIRVFTADGTYKAQYISGLNDNITGDLGVVPNRVVRVDGVTGRVIKAGVDVYVSDSGELFIGTMGVGDRALQLGEGKAARGYVNPLIVDTTITVDFATGNFFTCTLTGSHALGTPLNIQPGQAGCIFIINNNAGTALLTYAPEWDFVGGNAPALSTTANAVDRLDYVVRTSGSVLGTLSRGWA